MKILPIHNLRTGLSLSLMFLLMVFLWTSCATKHTFMASSVVPAARGTVEVKKDKSNNNVIKVKITNLAEVTRLQPPRQTYVVWMLTTDEMMRNIGLVKSGKNLKVDFETTSSFTPVKIVITAEDDANTQYPSNQVVLSTDRFVSGM